MQGKHPLWCGHPRPQMKREGYCILNGIWKLNGSSIQIPFPPQSELSEYKGEITENLHYEYRFTIPTEFTKERILLHFGAVDQIGVVKINHKEVGKHEGGYLPFFFDITRFVHREEENLLEVFAKDDLSLDYPYGKQSKNPKGMWYTPVSGIWQTVWLENVPDTYVERILLKPKLDQVTVKVMTNKPASDYQVSISLPDGQTLKQKLINGKGEISIPEPVNWTPENPYLYDMQIQVETDLVETYFALRTVRIEKVDGIYRVCLNQRPVFLHGVLDQGYFKEGIFLPETEEGFEKDVRNMKELGFNMLRKHIKVEPEYFYFMCDKLGMLVMQDMVNNGSYSFWRDTLLPTIGWKKRRDRRLGKEEPRRVIFEKHTKMTIEHLYNHPSVIAYTIFNEGWGQFNSDEMYDYVKNLDDTRIVDTTSGWYAQKKNDFDSQHIYFRLKKLKVKKRPLFVSECGGYKLLDQEHFFGVKEYGYGTCKNKADLTGRIIKMYEKMILPAVEKGLCGCVYTQVCDVEGEINGLYTYDRKVCKVEKKWMRTMAAKLYEEMDSIKERKEEQGNDTF